MGEEAPMHDPLRPARNGRVEHVRCERCDGRGHLVGLFLPRDGGRWVEVPWGPCDECGGTGWTPARPADPSPEP